MFLACQAVMLLLEDPKHKGRKPDEGWIVNGSRVYICEEPNGLPNSNCDSVPRQTTHTRVWDGSDVLVDYLEHAYRPTKPPKHVVELGAGCGLAGIADAVLFPEADVMLTDVAPCLQNLRANIERSVLVPTDVRSRALTRSRYCLLRSPGIATSWASGSTETGIGVRIRLGVRIGIALRP